MHGGWHGLIAALRFLGTGSKLPFLPEDVVLCLGLLAKFTRRSIGLSRIVKDKRDGIVYLGYYNDGHGRDGR